MPSGADLQDAARISLVDPSENRDPASRNPGLAIARNGQEVNSSKGSTASRATRPTYNCKPSLQGRSLIPEACGAGKHAKVENRGEGEKEPDHA